MYILGINAYHGDSSACLLKDGKVIAASEEERFRRIKHWAGFPSRAISFCLNDAGITAGDIDYITVSKNPGANLVRKIVHVIRSGMAFNAVFDRMKNRGKFRSVLENVAGVNGLTEGKIKAKLIQVEHHRSHLASAFFASPFREAALLSLDGFGDFTSTMLAVGNGHTIRVIDKVVYPHSLGIFYTALTQYLGFPHYGDEYKVMGLAPYGKPIYTEALRNVIKAIPGGLFNLDLSYFTHSNGGVSMTWQDGAPEIQPVYSSKLEELIGPERKKGEEVEQRHRDIAASVQCIAEEIIFHVMHTLHARTGLDNLCLAGGVAQNSVANGKITGRTPFKNIYIPAAGHDAGTAMGSALYAYHAMLTKKPGSADYNAYTGSRFSTEEVADFLRERGERFEILEDGPLLEKVAGLLVEGAVVGWFQGRSEFGPRALGHRSILADPRRKDAKDLINRKIKRRESFRPFAPSILEEYADEYFLQSDKVPFMEKVFPIRAEKRDLIPAVTHVDGSGRLQTVSKGDRYYDLINEFYKRTGVPILLNTSFNENEPMVNEPSHALDCYLRTEMDALVMENCILTRKR